MIYQIEIKEKSGLFDPLGHALARDILDLGIRAVKEVNYISVYFLLSDLGEKAVEDLCREVFSDPISQEYCFFPVEKPTSSGKTSKVIPVLVSCLPGVMDPVRSSALSAIHEAGISEPLDIRTARKYLLRGNLSKNQIKTICEKLIYNKTIETILEPKDIASLFQEPEDYKFSLRKIPLSGASERELAQISHRGHLFLNGKEMAAIAAHFKKLKRDPTDCEIETLAQTWSEHCVHKTFRGDIDYSEMRGSKIIKRKKIKNLLKSTIMKVTRELNKDWCVSVFKDNSGIIRFDDEDNVCFKVETHNHPSALEPFGGANTGIGGVIRDILGTGLGAKPIFNTDVFCFGPPDYPARLVPKGCLHPKRVAKGVVSGVKDYGNKMGIPTVNGAVLFHESFIGNPLVFCGTAGLIPKDKCFGKAQSGDLIVVLGGRTGRDGIHGATFSSGELTHESEERFSSAVQIGNPITQKKLADVLLKARDMGLYRCVTDCGAGGLSSAVGEMGLEIGACVHLEKVPLKYQGLRYDEIWISEAQERMVLSVPPENRDVLLRLCESEDAEASVIGEFTSDRRLKLFYEGNSVCDLEMDFLHEGIPLDERKAVWKEKAYKEPSLPKARDLTGALKKTLSHPNVCSKEWVIRQYDHEVQGGSVLKPLVGVLSSGPSDASIVRPKLNSSKAIAVSNGINFLYGDVDPYWMAASCIDEALRQITCVGGSFERTAILDNFCWGNPDKPDRLGGLVRCSLGCYDIAKAYGVPFISGKDSLNNEYRLKSGSRPILGTLLISALGIIDTPERVISMDVKEPGNSIYIVGKTYDELGGSIYLDLLGKKSPFVPQVDPRAGKKTMKALLGACQRGLLRSMHDCSEGGLAVACAEMAFAGGYGMDIFLGEIPFEPKNTGKKDSFAHILFSESNSRFIVEVESSRREEFEKALKGIPFGLMGCVLKDKIFRVFGFHQDLVVADTIFNLQASWQNTLKDLLH